MKKVSKTQIADWKKDHNVTEIIRLFTPDGSKSCYLRKPKRSEMSYIGTIKDPMKFNAALLEACWLDGDQEIQTSDELFMGISDKLVELLNFAEFEMEKL